MFKKPSKSDLFVAMAISCGTCVLLLTSCSSVNYNDDDMMNKKSQEFQRAPYDLNSQETRPRNYNNVNDLRR